MRVFKSNMTFFKKAAIFFSVLACSAGVFFERAICSRKRHVETSRREEEMGRVKGSGEEAGREKSIFFLLSPSPLSFFRPRIYRKGYYFYSHQSSTVIKSKMAATPILPTRTRFRPPKIRLHCRLFLFKNHYWQINYLQTSKTFLMRMFVVFFDLTEPASRKANPACITARWRWLLIWFSLSR